MSIVYHKVIVVDEVEYTSLPGKCDDLYELARKMAEVYEEDAQTKSVHSMLIQQADGSIVVLRPEVAARAHVKYVMGNPA
jgi:hypothetical protein